MTDTHLELEQSVNVIEKILHLAEWTQITTQRV